MKPVWNDIEVFDINTEKRSGAGYPAYAASGSGVVALDGKWKFMYCQSVCDAPKNFYKKDNSLKNFVETDVPSEWQIKGFGTPIYTNTRYPYALESKKKFKIPFVYGEKNPVGLYVKDFDAQADGKQNIFINFGGINSAGEIYVNGEFVGFSADTFSETEFDITKYVVSGKNRLAVRVYQFTAASYLEDQDMWRLAGIFRSVKLVYKPKTEIKDVYVRSTLTNNYKSAVLKFDAEIRALRENYGGGALDVSITGADGTPLYKKTYSASGIADGQTLTLADSGIMLDGIELWSHESPYLYDITFTLSENGSIKDIRKQKYGFRSIEIAPLKNGKGPYILLNGKPLKICGVNRHEFHPEYGHSVPKDITESDIKLLLANNVTAIRTAHYPNARHFYELCDEYGILVMSECNLETHGLASLIPHNSDLWYKHCAYRASNMVNSFKNHACVIFWSLGNESGVGSVFKRMKETILKIDSTRPIHYEPDNTMEVSDVLSEMYAPLAKMPKIGENKPITHSRALWNLMLGYFFTAKKYRDKPFIQCEYAHAMGNSLGNFADYQREFEKYDRLAGGFIWDFADQAIARTDRLGNKEYCYGGDFFDKPNDGIFAFNGIVRADRSPNPALYEVKAQYARVRISYGGGYVFLKNNFLFTDLNKFSLRLSRYTEGVLDETVSISLPHALPGEEIKVQVPFDTELFKKETYLNVEILTKEKSAYAPKGHVAAYGQFILRESLFATPRSSDGLGYSADLLDTDGYLFVGSKAFSLSLEKASGAVVSYTKDGKELLSAPFKPNFWRAPIDNDSILQVPILSKLLGFDRYKRAMKVLKPKNIAVSSESGAAVIDIDWAMPNLIYLKTRYKISGDGSIEISMNVKSFINLIRYGFHFAAAEGIDGVRFYGRGPHENYVDRKSSALLGVYKGEAEDFIHDYLHPQENGNHTDVRWLEIGGAAKKGGFLIRADACGGKAFGTSVHPYSLEMLENAKHANELTRLPELHVYIDGGQRGVGGDVPAMAMLKKPYKLLHFKEHSFTFKLSFLNGQNEL
ncbi:MAG: DUF4981 domain-containing protein [Clostridiales bacterium]|jgi:beta-galactosidase|nr:DUF4981 domain-containing protein [Clostridiales bacterium]